MDDERGAILEAARDLVSAHLAALERFPQVGRAAARDVLDGLDRAFTDLATAIGSGDAAPLGDELALASELDRGVDVAAWSRAFAREALADASGAAFSLRQALAAAAWRVEGATAADVAEATAKVERARLSLEESALRALDAIARWAGETPSRDARVAPLVAGALALGAPDAARALVRAALERAGAGDAPVARALEGARDPVAIQRVALHADLVRARRFG